MLSALCILGLGALLLCWAATPLCRELFLRLNLVDRPDGRRKLHSRAVPRIGGIAIVVSYATSLGAMSALAPHSLQIYFHIPLLLAILPSAVIIFLTGVLDDLLGLRPRYKIAGQLLASCLAVTLGVATHVLIGAPLLHLLTFIASVIWLVSCTNAFNLIDGLDGLATGLGLLTALTILLAALIQGNLGLAIISMPLAGCLLGFLRYNFSPASVFLGDCGSMTIGFLLGCFGLVWSQHTASAWSLAAPLMAMAVPLIDVAVAIARRALSSRPIFAADRGHIHHRLLAKGFGTRAVALQLYAACAVAAAFALLASVIADRLRAPVFILFWILVFYGIRHLGYAEFRLARKLLSRKWFLRRMSDELYLHDLRSSLTAVQTSAECWAVVRTLCRDLQFDSIRLCLQGKLFEEIGPHSAGDYLWSFTIELGAGAYLQLARAQAPDAPQLMISALQAVQASIRAMQPAAGESALLQPLSMAVEDAQMLA